MLTFLTPIAWTGCALIALALWQRFAILPHWRTPRNEQKPHPGQLPPASGSGCWSAQRKTSHAPQNLLAGQRQFR